MLLSDICIRRPVFATVLSLAVMLIEHDCVGRRSRRRQAILEPRECGRGRGILVAQSVQQLDGQRARQRHVVPRLQYFQQRFGCKSMDAEQSISQLIRALALRTVVNDPLRRASQVLHQHDPQRDGDGPQLADRERLHPLVGTHEPAQQLRIEAAVRVGDEGPDHPEDARISRERAAGELWQLPIVSGREVVADRPDLVLDHVVVVHQPLGRGSEGAPLGYSFPDSTIGVE